jgi:hypothetical protein
VLGQYRAVCWDHTECCVGIIQNGVLGPYIAVFWDHTLRCVGTIQSGVLGPTERCVGIIQNGVLGPYGKGEVSTLNGCNKERLNLQLI